MAHFVPCHIEITAEEAVDPFIENCHKLHGVLKVIVSDRDPRFDGNYWQAFMRKLNTKLNMSTEGNVKLATTAVYNAQRVACARGCVEGSAMWGECAP